MAEWNLYAGSLDEQRVQQRRAVTDRPVNARARERNRNVARMKPDGKVYTPRQVGKDVQAARTILNEAAELVRRVDVLLLRAEESFERAGYHLEIADSCLGRARERILQLQSDQVEQRIQSEAELALQWLSQSDTGGSKLSLQGTRGHSSSAIEGYAAWQKRLAMTRSDSGPDAVKAI